MNKYVLDASAILALLNNETGAGLVQDLMPESVISAVNYAEVVSRLALLGMPENEIHETLDILGLDIIQFDREQAFRTGMLANGTRQFGLSLGDRACLALSLKSGAAALTSDRVWQDLKIGVDVKVIR